MSILKLVVVTALPLLISVPAMAQIGSVEGYVNGPDGKPVQGAVVGFDKIDNKAHTETKTDKKGYFALYALMNGDYNVTVTVDGQLRDRRNMFHVSPGRQSQTIGNNANGLVFNLKSPEAAAAEMKKEAAQDAGKESDASKKAREEALAKAKALNDNYATGKAALEAKQYDTAVESLAKAAELDPKQGAVWSALADAYMGVARGKKGAEANDTYQKAFDAFNKAIEIAPTNAGNYNNFALALAANNKLDDAKSKLAKAIELDPAGAGKYHYNMGAFLMNVSQSDAAVEEFKKSIAADANYAESYFYLGSMLAGKSTMDAAGKMIPPDGTVDALQKYLSLKPDGPNAPAAKDLIAALGSKIDVNYKDPNAPAKGNKKTK
jgi:tetratricopeptide (TPR) repeat protein